MSSGGIAANVFNIFYNFQKRVLTASGLSFMSMMPKSSDRTAAAKIYAVSKGRKPGNLL